MGYPRYSTFNFHILDVGKYVQTSYSKTTNPRLIILICYHVLVVVKQICFDHAQGYGGTTI